MIPAEQYSENVLSEEPVDNTGRFIKECGHNHFFMDNFTEGRALEISCPDDDDDYCCCCCCNSHDDNDVDIITSNKNRFNSKHCYSSCGTVH